MALRLAWACKPRENPYSMGIAIFNTAQAVSFMFRILSQIAGLMSFNKSLAPAGDVAHQLMERADAGAGRDPRQAQELRRAARAFLSVVR